MSVTRRSTLALLPLAVAGLGLAACAKTQSTANPGSTANQADLDFITNAYDVIHFDTEICNIAEAQATNPRVKAIAARILEEAQAFRAKIKPIAESEGISPPTVLRSDLRIRLGHARLQNGVSFDQTFLADEIATHQEALDRAQAMSTDTAVSPQLQAYAREGEGLLRTNLAQLDALQKQVGMSMG